MITCVAPNHPDCYHECADGKCVAIYEKETHTCFRGCGGRLLGLGLVSAIRRTGWEVITSAQAHGVSGPDVSIAAGRIAVLRESNLIVRKFGEMPATITDGLLKIFHMSLARSTSRRRQNMPPLDLRWDDAPLSKVLEVMASAYAAALDS